MHNSLNKLWKYNIQLCFCRNLGGCTGGILLVVMQFTWEIPHSCLEKSGYWTASIVVHHKKPESNTSNRFYLHGTRKKAVLYTLR